MPVFLVFNAVAAVGCDVNLVILSSHSRKWCIIILGTIKTIRAVNSVMVGSKQAIQSLFGILIILNIAVVLFLRLRPIETIQEVTRSWLYKTRSLCTVPYPHHAVFTWIPHLQWLVCPSLQYSDEMMFDKNESESIDFLSTIFWLMLTTKQAIQNVSFIRW